VKDKECKKEEKEITWKYVPRDVYLKNKQLSKEKMEKEK